MRARAVVGRGVRLGVLIGAWPAGVAGVVCLVAAFVFLTAGQHGAARALTVTAALAVLGALAVGVGLGTLTGLALALAPRWLLVRPLLRASLAGLTAGLPLVWLLVAFLTGDGYSLASYPASTYVVDWSVILTIALVAAARSGEIAGPGADG